MNTEVERETALHQRVTLPSIFYINSPIYTIYIYIAHSTVLCLLVTFNYFCSLSATEAFSLFIAAHKFNKIQDSPTHTLTTGKKSHTEIIPGNYLTPRNIQYN